MQMPTQMKNVPVYGDTKQRMDDLKPYDSMSYDEFMGELLDAYEESQ